jgi:hypothetical protein
VLWLGFFTTVKVCLGCPRLPSCSGHRPRLCASHTSHTHRPLQLTLLDLDLKSATKVPSHAALDEAIAAAASRCPEALESTLPALRAGLLAALPPSFLG